MAKMINLHELRLRLGYSRRHMYRLIKAGHLPALRVGPRTRFLFNTDEIEKHLHRANRVQELAAKALTSIPTCA
jgi:excisionase family DNA binding protein